MKLIGLMPVRNEAWCLGLTLRAALQWCDEVVVLLHSCTDSSEIITGEIIREGNEDRITLVGHNRAKWAEMNDRQAMLELARARGATHMAIVDADEIVTGNISQATLELNYASIRGFINAIPKGTCLQLPLYNLRGSLDRYHANGVWGNRWLSVAFKDEPGLSWAGDKFHDREPRYADGSKLKAWKPIEQGRGGVMHLWGVSERRLRAKHALYKITERLGFPAKSIHEINNLYNVWRTPHDSTVMWPDQPQWGKEWTFADVPAEWWKPYDAILLHLQNYDPLNGVSYPADSETLWQEVEVRRLVAEHGIETFKGLDLFGIA